MPVGIVPVTFESESDSESESLGVALVGASIPGDVDTIHTPNQLHPLCPLLCQSMWVTDATIVVVNCLQSI